MNKADKVKRIILTTLSYLLVAAVAAVLTYQIAFRVAWNDMSKIDRLESVIDEYYIEDYDLKEIEDAAAAAMVDALGNPWSYYVSADEYGAYMDRQANSYVGIGIVVVRGEDDSGLLIQKVESSGGAAQAGILPGDVIIAIDGQDIRGMDMTAASNLISGEDSTVSLTILREGEEHTFKVERKRLQVTVAKGQMLEGNVGLVTIVNFNERSAEETISIIKDLTEQGAEALIFDVRFNPGGYKDEMVKVLDYLLPEGKLFQSVDYLGNEETDRSDSKCLELPMAVLINEDSYSAAEFFAAALQEYEWATVVGTPSTGKSHFQITIELDDGSAVNLSVGKYYTPEGVSLADVGGLHPDVKVEVDTDTYMKIYFEQLPAEEDPQIAAALEVVKAGE